MKVCILRSSNVIWPLRSWMLTAYVHRNECSACVRRTTKFIDHPENLADKPITPQHFQPGITSKTRKHPLQPHQTKSPLFPLLADSLCRWQIKGSKLNFLKLLYALFRDSSSMRGALARSFSNYSKNINTDGRGRGRYKIRRNDINRKIISSPMWLENFEQHREGIKASGKSQRPWLVKEMPG